MSSWNASVRLAPKRRTGAGLHRTISTREEDRAGAVAYEDLERRAEPSERQEPRQCIDAGRGDTPISLYSTRMCLTSATLRCDPSTFVRSSTTRISSTCEAEEEHQRRDENEETHRLTGMNQLLRHASMHAVYVFAPAR